MNEADLVVGIDVAKAWLDVVVGVEGTPFRVANDAAGWTRLCDQLRPLAPTRVVLEASGGYEQGAARAVAAAGLTPVIANPLETRYFARSQGRKAKTDRLDARLLAHFGAERRPPARPLRTPTEETAHALLIRRRELTTMLAMEQTRRHQAAPAVQASLDRLITLLQDERRALDADLAAVVARAPTLQARVDRLRTVPGIGVLIATVLAVEVPQLGGMSAKELASLLGIAPFACDSGQRHGQRTISGGKGWVRHLLYEGILTTIRRDPTFAAYYQQLRAGDQPKPVKVARIACIRKLLGIVTAMMRDELTWPETEVGQGWHLPAAA
jgi:transposase